MRFSEPDDLPPPLLNPPMPLFDDCAEIVMPINSFESSRFPNVICVSFLPSNWTVLIFIGEDSEPVCLEQSDYVIPIGDGEMDALDYTDPKLLFLTLTFVMVFFLHLCLTPSLWIISSFFFAYSWPNSNIDYPPNMVLATTVLFLLSCWGFSIFKFKAKGCFLSVFKKSSWSS